MKNNGSWVLGFLVFLGIPLFLLMSHPIVFWCVFIPLSLLTVVSIILWLNSGGMSFGYVIVAVVSFIAIIVTTMIVCIPKPCEHEEVQTRYIFVSYDSPSNSSAAQFCKKCDERLTSYSSFKGTLVDQSYLEALKEHSDGNEIVPGEYYTVTATAHLGYYGYGSKEVWLNCDVENDDYLLRFNVEFKEEFGELVKLVEDDEVITFRGRFYDEGCGFTDCELISN